MKICKVYYATVAAIGNKMNEPIRVEGQEPLGKLPEFCCKDLEDAVEASIFAAGGDSMYVYKWVNNCGRPWRDIKFCPFCGAEIVYESDLTVRVVKAIRTHSHESHHYEKI